MMMLMLVMVSIVIFTIVLYFKSREDYFLDPRGKVVFITGCDSGIGRYLALKFASMGCVVFAGCLNRTIIVTNDDDIASIHLVQLDVTDPESVRSALSQLKDYLQETESELWCLINNAGVCTCGEFDWLTMEQCDRLVQVNLLGTIRVTKSFLPLLRRSRGRLITITSVNGFVAYPGLSVYSATKFALEGFHDALRIELDSHGVSVALVQPGDLARLTSIMAGHKKEASQMWDGMSEEYRREYGPYFRQYHESVVRNYGISSPSRFEDSKLPRDVEHAMLSDEPKPRYLSAPFVYICGYKLLAALPTRVRDYVLGYIAKSVLHR